jgi:hypothetical protein
MALRSDLKMITQCPKEDHKAQISFHSFRYGQYDKYRNKLVEVEQNIV